MNEPHDAMPGDVAGQDESPDWAGDLDAIAGQQDKAAFARVYSHFAPRVASYLKGLGMNAAQAEELAQETMIRVWKKAHQYDPGSAAVSTWTFRIARNLFIDEYRRKSSRPTESLDDHHYEPAADLAEASSQIDGAQAKALLSTLPPLQAQVVHKSYFDGLSHSEIARDLEIPLGTVKSNLRLAFAKLRKAMVAR